MKKVVLTKDLLRLFPEKESFLERADIKVIEVGTNDDALRVCMKEPVDLIVTSLDMPGMVCEDLVDSLRSNDRLKHVSIIIVCQDTLAHRERCKRCRANAVLTIPVNPAALLMKMQQFLSVALRMQYRTALAVAIEGKFRDRPVPFWTENISESGMLIRAAEPLSQGSGVFISFFLPDGAHISGYGEIIRVERMQNNPDEYRYGVKFTNIDQEARAAIETFVRLRSRLKGQNQDG